MLRHQVDNEFYFGTRQINRNNRLEQGYWFLGNEYYLSIPFWEGRDPIAKIPFAAFTIVIDGSSYLEVNFKNYPRNTDFFQEHLLNRLNIGYSNARGNYRKDYDLDYITALETFLAYDKLIIDSAITNHHIRHEATARHEYLDFIGLPDFERQIDNIEFYQERRKYKFRYTGYLQGFNITKFDKIANIDIEEIPQGCRWIFLTGENGTGKTTVLRALAAGLLNNNDNGTRLNPDCDVNILLELPDEITRLKIKGEDDITAKKPNIPGFAAYGPIRLITESSLNTEFSIEDISEKTKRSTYGLFHPIGILKDINSSIIFSGVRYKEQEMEQQRFLDSIELHLPNILPGIAYVSVVNYEDNSRELLYHRVNNKNIPSEGIPFKQLSSGTQNFAALIYDLLVRFSERDANATDPSNFVGIVLIDEIDLHLHPKMQKEIVKQLSATFPNIQFIVSTHSPIPMLGAPENAVFINLYRDEEDVICGRKLDIEISNLLPNTILTSPIFGFQELTSENHDPSERLVTEDDYSEEIFYRILEKKIRDNSLIPGQKDDPPTA